MKRFFTFSLILLSTVLVGCAGNVQQPLNLDQDFWAKDQLKVGVVMSEVPKVDVALPGAACLLCLAVAEAANSSLSKHANTFSTDSIKKFHEEVALEMEKQGIATVVIEEPIKVSKLPKHSSKLPNSSRKDFSFYKTKQDITHLVVIDITHLGIIRSYANYIPTSDPKGAFHAKSYMVNLSDNTYNWYNPIVIEKSVSDGWKEPPTYPGLTNAYYQAIETAKESILTPLTSKPKFEERVNSENGSI